MNHSPYAAPKSEQRDAPRGPGSPVKAVLLGVLTDIVGTILASILVSSIFGAMWAGRLNEEQMMAVMKDASLANPFILVVTIFGLAASYLSGFVCARIARQLELRYGAMVALISVGIALVLSMGEYPLLWMLSMSALTIIATLLGALHARAKNSASRAGAGTGTMG